MRLLLLGIIIMVGTLEIDAKREILSRLWGNAWFLL